MFTQRHQRGLENKSMQLNIAISENKGRGLTIRFKPPLMVLRLVPDKRPKRHCAIILCNLFYWDFFFFPGGDQKLNWSSEENDLPVFL